MKKKLLAGLSALFMAVSLGVGNLSFPAAASEPEPVFPKATTAPVMDGVIDEVWDEAPAYYLPYVDYYYWAGGEQTWTEDDKINHIYNSYFKLLWDEEHIYFLVDVKDTTRFEDGADSLDIYFRELDNEEAQTQLQQISFNRMPNSEGKFVSKLVYQGLDTEYAIKENEDGYVFEWILDRDRGETNTIKEDDWAAGNRFQVNITINDDRDGADYENWKGVIMKLREYQVSYLTHPVVEGAELKSGYLWTYNASIPKSKFPGLTLVDEVGQDIPEDLPQPTFPTDPSKPYEPTATTLPKIGYGSPVMDGKIDELWNSMPKYYLNELMLSEGGQYSNDCEGSYFQMIWDEDNLYLLVNIIDDTAFDADKISFFFREQNLPEGEVDAEAIPGETCHIIHAGCTRGATEIVLKDAPGVTDGTTVPCFTANTNKGWMVEWKIPRDRGDYTGMPDAYFEGHEIQMNVVYENDLDGQLKYIFREDDFIPWREYQVSWAKAASEGGIVEEGTYRWWLMPRTIPAVYLTKEDLSSTSKPEDASSTPSSPSSDISDDGNPDTGVGLSCGILLMAIAAAGTLAVLGKQRKMSCK